MFALMFIAASVLQAAPVEFERITLTNRYYCDGIASADFNADGHADVVAGPYWYAGPTFLESHEIYEPVALVAEESPSNSMFSFTHDFDGDSWPDVLVLGRVHKHEARWYQNPGNSEGEWKSHFVFERIRGESPTLISLFKDDTRQLICHWEGCWGYVQPVAGKPFEPWTFTAIGDDEQWPQFYHGEGVGDVNGDGRLDVIINDGWYEQPGQPANGDWPFHRGKFSKGRGGAQMFVDDLDGDGDSDVISAVDAHGWGLAWYEQLSRNRSHESVKFVEHLLMNDHEDEERYGVAFTQPHALAYADINADGRRDIVVGKRMWAHGPTGDIEPNADPVLYWFEALDPRIGGVKYIPHLIDNRSGVGVQIQSVDVNGDGRNDVLTASKLGSFVFLNRGSK